ncbi:MAG: hypothetical protein CVU05_02610 [Bacteroidetes bacterium HGW-Bacteroidetes-21]|nr:MAG: hypothetical protein CVU05_02610 [Bacteroidetes bacterium HGW-Bacteroidetes-21]
MRLFALTGGPSQPEVQSFEPIGTSEMVNLFSGDFVYNIPLVDVGGYPINISYHSGVTMDQEASWVGLGWNINPGAITRNMRGIPDDFNGELIDSEFNMKNNYTFGLNSSAILGDEMLGVSLMSLEMGFGVNYNNYKGVGFNVFAIPSIGASLGSAGRMSLGLGVSAGTFEGVTVNPSLSFNASTSAANSSATSLGVGVNVGLSINSRAGLSTLTMGVNPSVSGGSRNIMGESNSKGSRGSVGTNIANSTITFASPTYVPNVEYPMININQSFNATLGGALFGLHGIDIRLKGFYSHQALMYTSESNPAWGYMFSQNAVGRPNAIYDFNREKDGSFSENTPNLPPTNFTYDVFSVSGQGIGGMYRPFRSDVGVVYDKNSFNLGTSPANLGFEVGTGNATHFGIDYQNNTTNTTSGKWKSNESVTGKLKFKGNNPTNRYYEPYYFKNAGEMSYENDMNFFSNIGQYSPVHVALTGPSVSKQAAGNYVEGGSMNTNTRSTRSIRDQHISVLNSEMADKFAASRKIEVFYGFNVSPNGKYIPDQVIDRTSTPYKPNHISEVTVSRPDGARYIYGIPAYNLSQKEVTFAVQQDVTACDDYQISYSPSDADASTNNKGMDNFVSKKSIPPYAHSYLLTHILSVDYVDADDIPGPSDGDYGTYTKINYSKQCENYNWRTPYLNATYNEGMKTFDNDDKASYIFGTKEIWNVHSIESKTHLAEFYLSEREDGRDAGGEHPTGSGNGTSMKLDSIRVFSKQDRIKNGANAIPIKTVHFVYEYLLCPEVLNSNSNSGKLTLTKLYFTYGNSKKGMLNSYVFNYSEENPKYSTHSFDRWGNYKEDNGNGCDFTQEPSNAEYPYAEQDKAKADLFSEAWSLTSIKLPSGGVIDVNYESDDYAYVQNKKAMEMVKVIGATNDINATPNSSLMSSGNSVNNYLIFRLNKPIDVSNSQASNIVQKMLKDEYGNTPEFIYYKFLLELDAGKYEFVPGYCKVEAIGLMPAVSGQYINGYLKITPVGIDDDGGGDPVNPITKSAWNFARLYTPQYVYSQPTNATGSLENVLQALASPFLQIWQFVTGINENLRSRGMGFNFSNSKSYVRLYNGDGFKFGGGSRVKKITIGDSWQTMTNASDNDNMVYGQEYDYTTKTKKGEIISSGVASYEPIIGGDENPWRQPIYYSEEKLMVPDDTYYKETPYGESFFPSPSVGYSKVSVMNLQWKNILINSQNRSVTKHATGKVVNEFYTAKDYPTQVTQTSLDKDRYKHQPLFQILKFESEDYMTASQGYAVILNDMHGKQKAQWVYQEDKNEPISGIEYFYKTNGGYNDIKANSLNNYVQIIKKNNSGGGRITSGMIGVEYDHVVDMREYESTTSGGGANFNLDIFVIPAPIPVTLYIPTLFPSFVYEQTRFRSVVATKVINQYGVLSKTVAHDLGSKISTTNMLWDANTGNVLLTKTQNSFDDPLYSFTYPAHWGYDRMGQVYKNIGIEFYGQSINDLGAGYFVKWDELGLVNGSTVTTGWVSNVVQSGPNPGITVIDRDGNEINPFADYDLIKIIRSGRRNQSSVPIGTVVSMESPIRQVGSEKDIVFDNDTRVVQAQSMEYSDEWRLFCDCGHLPGATINPVIKGIRGNWRPETSYLFLVDRSITRNSDNTDVREDGVFENFNPFWIPSLSGTDWEKDETNWTWATKATEYSPQGFELENKDALGRYSSAVYGYNYSLPVGVASNAMFREIGFDNFEDYDFGHCVQDHFSFKAYPNFVTQDDAHSGKRSIRVGAGVSLGVIKNLIDCGESTYDEYTQQYH